MNELIKINENTLDGALVQTVSARELHEFLGVGKDFTNWVKGRLNLLGSEENKDFLVLAQIGENGGRPKTEYFLTLDVAKHLAMMEKSIKGKEIRDYFIECEKRLREVSLTPKEHCFIGILRASDELSTTLAIKKLDDTIIKPLEQFKQEATPKVEFYDSVTQSDTTLDIGAVSKVLNYKGLGRNKLFRYLRDNKIINHKNIPYQQYITLGYFKLVETSYVNPNNQDLEVSIKAVMFQKGIDWLNKKLKEDGYKKV